MSYKRIHIIFTSYHLYTLWLFNIAMENGPFIDDFPSYKPPFSSGILHGYVSHNQMVITFECSHPNILTSDLFSSKSLRFSRCRSRRLGKTMRGNQERKRSNRNEKTHQNPETQEFMDIYGTIFSRA